MFHVKHVERRADKVMFHVKHWTGAVKNVSQKRKKQLKTWAE